MEDESSELTLSLKLKTVRSYVAAVVMTRTWKHCCLGQSSMQLPSRASPHGAVAAAAQDACLVGESGDQDDHATSMAGRYAEPGALVDPAPRCTTQRQDHHDSDQQQDI